VAPASGFAAFLADPGTAPQPGAAVPGDGKKPAAPRRAPASPLQHPGRKQAGARPDQTSPGVQQAALPSCLTAGPTPAANLPTPQTVETGGIPPVPQSDAAGTTPASPAAAEPGHAEQPAAFAPGAADQPADLPVGVSQPQTSFGAPPALPDLPQLAPANPPQPAAEQGPPQAHGATHQTAPSSTGKKESADHASHAHAAQPNAASRSPSPDLAANPQGSVASAAGAGAGQGTGVRAAPALAMPPHSAPADPGATPPAASQLPAAPAVQIGQAVAALHIRPDGGSRLTIRFDPAELGLVQIRIDRTHEGAASISVAVERVETLRALQTDVTHLHLALDRAGVPEQQRSLTFHLASPQPDAGQGTAQHGAQQNAGGGFQQHGRPSPWTMSAGQAGAGQFADIFSLPDSPGRARPASSGLNITA